MTGCDGSPRYGQRLTSEGKLAATVVVPSVVGTAVDQIAATLRGNAGPAETLLAPSSFPALPVLERLAS